MRDFSLLLPMLNESETINPQSIESMVIKIYIFCRKYSCLCMNQQKIDQLAERILNETLSAMSCLNLYLGHRLNLFQSIVESGPVSSAELSNKTKYSERYLREWLECMTVLGYIEHDSRTNKFSISQEHAVVLCERDNSAYTIPFVYCIPSFASVVDKLLEAFRSGKGVPYSAYGQDLIFAQGEGNRPMFVNDIGRWISSMPDVENKLKSQGGRVLEVGCGDGWASIALARLFPMAKIDAIDADYSSIENASRNVQEAGLSHRISLHLSTIEKTSLKEKYDLVMTFESVHDIAYPIKALEKMREILAPRGSVLVGDVKMKEVLEEKNDFPGRFYYNFSVLLCLPQSMAYPDSKATGAAMSPSIFKNYAKEAGFSKIDVLPVKHFIWEFYRLES
jgi:ubiquinone/menaquinone biosynthesis C-methylase UbiE